ncbi:MAG TPA: dienelactone hydrolase family protein [Burkholderiales bacterium]
MTIAIDPPVELQTSAPPTATVIWLHGLGADGRDFAGIVPELGLPANLGVRFVFPHAPMRPVTINGGMVMRAWYDIALTAGGFSQNAEHLSESVDISNQLIERERTRGVDASRIVVAGFSQGGAVALHTALRFGQRLAGAIVLSAPVPFIDVLLRGADPANTAVPIFLAHGVADPMVPFALGEAISQQLRALGRPVEWHPYHVAHGVNLEEIRDIGRFLTTVLS